NVAPSHEHHEGKTSIKVVDHSLLFEDTPEDITVWTCNGGNVLNVPPSFQRDAVSSSESVVAMSYPDEHLYGIQFYPEVDETEHGLNMLRQFLFNSCHCQGKWTTKNFIEHEIAKIKQQVGD